MHHSALLSSRFEFYKVILHVRTLTAESSFRIELANR